MIKQIFKKIFGSKTGKNAAWIISCRIIQMVLGLVVSMLTARFLGPSNYGLINYASAYKAFFASVCSLGINSVIVKEFVDNEQSDGTILGTSLILKGISSLLSMVMIISIVSVVDKAETITIVVVALSSLGILFNVLETALYWFQSKLLSKYTAIATLIGFLFTAIYRVILLIIKADIYYFVLINTIDYLLVGIILFFFYFKLNGDKLKFSLPYARVLLSRSWHFILPGLMVSIYAETDKIMLKHMISDSEIGYYSTAVAICNMWCFILGAIIDSFNPTIMEYHKMNRNDLYIKRNKQLYCLVFYVSIFVSTIIAIFAPLIIKILYGTDFLLATSPLRIITWYTAFSYLGVARNTWMVCENKQNYLIWLYMSSAIINIILNVLLIPIMGASGAAVASLSAQILTVLVVPLFIKPLSQNTIMMIEAIRLKNIR